MKNKLFIIVATLLLTSWQMYAQSGTCGENLTWTLENGTLTISGTGEMYSYAEPKTYAPWYSNRESIKSIIINKGVTSIGNQVFYNCRNLTSVTISNSVTKIGMYAFHYCTSLKSIWIPESVTHIEVPFISHCSSLSNLEVSGYNRTYDSRSYCNAIIKTATNTLIAGCKNTNIPNNVTAIASFAFDGQSELSSLHIPSSVTKIGFLAFQGVNLSWAYDGKSAFYIDDWLIEVSSNFTGTFTIKSGTKGMAESAFYYCKKGVSSVIIPESMLYIELGYCDNLTSVIWNAKNVSDYQYNTSPIPSWTINSITFGPSVEHIPAFICYGASSLKSIIFGENVKTIGECAFRGCNNLTSLAFPNSVTSIEEGAFEGCSSLTSITIPNSVTSIGVGAFWGCSSLTSITIPNSVTSIGVGAFYDCISLTSITIPNSVESIGENAFNGCSSLTSITIPNSVESIGDYAFYGCSSLTSITIPENVTSIGEGAFYYCSSLRNITWNAKKIEDFSLANSSPFYIIRDQIISVNLGSAIEHIPAYLCYGMSNLTSITIPENVTGIGDYAFNGCTGLKNITWNAKNCADFLYYCSPFNDSKSNITSFAFGLAVEHIPSNICREMSSLKSVTIPNSVTSIGDVAFCYCNGLKSVTIGNSVESIGAEAFCGCSSLTSVSIPKSVTEMDNNYVFLNCDGLKSISVDVNNPNYCSENGVLFDKKQTQLIQYPANKTGTSYTIPNGVIAIDNYAFHGNKNLTSISIPNSVIAIGAEILSNSSLYENKDNWEDGVLYMDNWLIKASTDISENYVIKDGTIGIANRGFFDTNLTSVTIPESVKYIGGSVFNGTPIYENSDNWQDDVLYIDNWLIQAKSDVAGKVTVKPGTRGIAGWAFMNCVNLSSVVIPDGIKNIGYMAFGNCKDLSSVTLPASVSNISAKVFDNCLSLDYIYLESAQPPVINVNCFSSSPVVYIPFGSLNAYKSTAWKEYDLRTFDLNVSVAAEPLSATIELNATRNQYNYNADITTCGVVNGNTFTGNKIELTNLVPEQEYQDIRIFYRTKYGDCDTLTVSFSTTAVQLTTLPSKTVSATTAILFAETNLPDTETNCGFEYKNKDALDDFTGSQVSAPLVNGQMIGKLNNLSDNIYYQYRPFYRSQTGKTYYGDWQYVYTGDAAADFSPVLYTYQAQSVTNHSAVLSGCAISGAEDFSEQGFEYYAENRTNAQSITPRRITTSVIGERNTVIGKGTVMNVILQDLDEGTIYRYRSYGIINDKTFYGNELSFVTTGEYIIYIVTFFDKNGNVISKQEVEKGGNAEAPEIPQIMGWQFTGWDSDFQNVQNDLNIYALYKECPIYTLTVTSSSTTMGRVTGGGTYNEGTLVQIEAIPNTGYRFVDWSDGVTDNPRSIRLTATRSLTARFEKIPNALDDTKTANNTTRKELDISTGQLHIILPDGSVYTIQGTKIK